MCDINDGLSFFTDGTSSDQESIADINPNIAYERTVVVDETIPNGSEVIITHVFSPQIVCIRLAAKCAEYAQLNDDVDEASYTVPRLLSFPKIGDIVMAPREGLYRRVEIVEVNKKEGLVLVEYIDFGDSTELAFSCLRVLPDKFIGHPCRRHTVKVNLLGVRDDLSAAEREILYNHLSVDLASEVNSYLVKCNESKVIQNRAVTLINVISNESISDQLNGLFPKCYRLHDLKQKIVEECDAEFAILYSEKLYKNCLTCILMADAKQLHEFDMAVQSYGASVENAPPYQPKLKELCLVKRRFADGEVWYRAQYQQALVNKKCQVHCIDYGETCTIREKNIRAITEDMAFEVLSFVARFENTERITKEHMKKLKQNDRLIAKEIKYDGGKHTIELV